MDAIELILVLIFICVFIITFAIVASIYLYIIPMSVYIKKIFKSLLIDNACKKLKE